MASILVIDDDRAVLGTIKLLLERTPHAVEAVDNSLAGLQLLGTHDFDLLIVDIFQDTPRTPSFIMGASTPACCCSPSRIASPIWREC